MTEGRLVKCTKCKKLFYFKAGHKHHSVDEVDVIEAGTNCPHCQEWLHLGYLNEDLLKRQGELKNNRQRRAFRRDYDKLQKEVSEWLKEVAEPVEM